MKTISLKTDDPIFAEMESILSTIQIPRSRAINEALKFYNGIQKRKILQERLEVESYLVKDESLSVLKEFEDID